MVKKHSNDIKYNVEKPLQHLKVTFRIIFGNYKLFLPLILVALGLYVLTMGASGDTFMLMMVLAVLTLWLASLLIIRHIVAGKELNFRDALYNAMAPLVPTLLVLVVLFAECIPIFLLIIGYSTAVEVNLFGNVFYGSVFVLVALLLVAVSAYFVSNSLMGLIAVSTPGTYPVEALILSSEMMKGKRLRLILRLFMMILVLGVIGAVILLPLAFVDAAVEFSIMPMAVFIVGCFAVIYAAVYLYIYYRWILDEGK